VNEQAADYELAPNIAMPAQSPASIAAADSAAKSSVDTLAAAPSDGPAPERRKEITDAPAEVSKTVVVRVLARREALENKAFDQLLASNGIEVDAEPADEMSTPVVRARSAPQLAPEGQAKALFKSTAPQPPASGIQDELVLVDAPAPVIESSLATLKADEVNYLGVAVEEAPAAGRSRPSERTVDSDFSSVEQNALADKAEVELDWTKYNRGTVPPLRFAG
jgi:hypothetical protein